MARRLTNAEFITRANLVHGNKFDYANIEYVNKKIKIEIKCNLHDVSFKQVPSEHLQGHIGCKECINIKRKKTMVDVYGVEHPMFSELIKEKIKQTNIERYGVENPSQFEEVKEKKKLTCLKNYGTENPLELEEVKEKKKLTNLEKYGVEYASQSEEVKKKSKQTNLERYGVESFTQSAQFKEKTKKTNLEKYGVEFAAQAQEVKEKKRQTNLEKYGVESFAQRHISQESIRKLNNKDWLIEQHHKEKLTLDAIAMKLGINATTLGRKYKYFDIEIKYHNFSAPEVEIFHYINSLGFCAEQNTRSVIPPLEIDIFIDESNKAIEFNGIYWHRGLGINYHKNKTDRCNKRNVQLMHIWEDEWEINKNNIKDKIDCFMHNIPQQPLLDEIIIDLSKENPQTYIDVGYDVIHQIQPSLYLDDIWDCGKLVLRKR